MTIEELALDQIDEVNGGTVSGAACRAAWAGDGAMIGFLAGGPFGAFGGAFAGAFLGENLCYP